MGIGDDLLGQLLLGTEVPLALRRPRAKDDVRAAAVQMRADGRTYDDIAVDLGVSKGTLSLWLRGLARGTGAEAVAASAPDDSTAPSLVERARELRSQGLLLKEIAEQLHVSAGYVSRCTRGMPWPERARHGGDAEHVRMMTEARWGAYRRERDVATQQRKLTAALSVGDVDDRTLLLLGAVAYWCEGAKSKPWRRQGTWTFINSDPALVRLMVRWLRLVDIPPDRWVVRIQIHETADVEAAEVYWRHVLGVPGLPFARETIKRHEPLTNRKNVGHDYHGCLSIYVRRGSQLLEQVEGWVLGALVGAGGAVPGVPMPWQEGGTLDMSELRS